jgi:regulatory protein
VKREKKQTVVYTVTQGLIKAQKYCAYQERCQQEVRNKIFDWGLHENEVEFIIAELISDNFLNEERYAKAFAGGKFRIKKWGRAKIKIELKKRKISEYCIKLAMKEINDEAYIETLKILIRKKAKEIKTKNKLANNYKLAQYAISRGFEADLVWDEINAGL